jgi:hypothetical protein
MGIHKRHVPGELAGKLKFERGPDGKIRPVQTAAETHPETIAEEKPPQPGGPPAGRAAHRRALLKARRCGLTASLHGSTGASARRPCASR